jgi:hypothetical protein
MIRYVAVLVLSVFALGTSTQNSPPAHQHAASTATATTHERFATFLADKGFQSTLLLENLRQDVPITVIPTLILEEGEISLEPVTVPAHDTASVDISAFLSSHGYKDKRGTVAVRYIYKTYGPLNAVVQSYNEANHIYLNSFGQSPEEYWAGTSFDAVVWAPDGGTKGFVSVTNTSKSVRTVQVTALFKGKSEQLQPLVISPRTTHFLAIDDLVERSQQDGVGIHVEFDEYPGDIIVESQLFNERTGFTKYIHFADTALQYPTTTLRTHFVLLGQQPVADGFPQQVSFRSVAAVRNISSIPLNVTPSIKYLDGGVVQTIPLPLLPLAVGQSAMIDLSAEKKSGRIPRGFRQGSLELVPDNDKGNMVAELFNFDEGTGGYVVGPSVSLYPNRGTASIWRIDGTFQTTIMVENTAAASDQVTLKLFSDGGTYNQTFSVPQGGLLKINVKDLQQNAVPDKDGQLFSGTYGTFSISGSHGAQSKLTFGKIIHSSDESDYVGLPPNPCDYVLGIGLWFDFSGGVNPFPVMADWDWSLSGVYTQPASGTVVSANYITISHNGSGDMATVNFANAVPGQSLFLNGPSTNATTCDACSQSAIYPAGTETMPVMPRILFGSSQTDITGTTQPVAVGQQIALTAKLPSGVSANSQSWSVPGTTVAGYTATAGVGSVNTAVVFNQKTTTFYWVFPPSSPTTVTFTLNYGNGQTATAQAFFNVTTPASATPTVTLPTNGLATIDTFTGCNGSANEPFLVFGNITGPVPPCPGGYKGLAGIAFSPPTTATPPGTFFFVQLVTGDNLFYPNLSCIGVPGLDGAYPYQSKYASPVNDAPFAVLPYTSVRRDFFATMYLMWQSTTMPSIPVPIGQVQWSFQASSTLTNGVWSAPTGGGGAGAFLVATTVGAYPTWTGLTVQANNNCH